MAKVKVSWAIRHYSQNTIDGSWKLFMTTHYATREELRKAYKNYPDFYKSGVLFKCTRHRVTEWELINKLEYCPTR